MKPAPPCPSRFEYQELLAGLIPVEASATLYNHLENCSHCADTIQELLATDRIDRLAVEPRLPAEQIVLPADLLAELLALNSAVSLPPAAEVAAPESIEGYEILEVLGRGGMGVVYKARQHGLNRFVALKMIRSGRHAGPAEIERFRAESEVVAKLQHPNIVQIHSVGTTDGCPYFALEYVDGGSLAQKLQGNPLPGRAAAQLAKTLAEAMQYAHEHGIIHRDLKPANILLSGVGDSGELTYPQTPQASGSPHAPLTGILKIGDFGLAKLIDTDSGNTATGAILGTPNYMPPEQAYGRLRELGPTSDVYSLGAILYEMLTGRPPFLGATMLETLDQVRTQDPVPPRTFQQGVSVDLETICLKCLHKDPRKRYSSAAELALDLGRFLEGMPIKARRVGPLEQTWKWAKRYPAVAALITVLLLATPALIGLWIQARSASANLVKANDDLGQQRDATRRREAELTFDKGLDLCNEGQIADGLLWMTRSLDIDPAMSPAFEKLVRTNLASWGQHKIQ